MSDDRFARHRLISGFDQSRVSKIKIGLIGAGAIGNEILKNLLLLGIGQVDVYDFDHVEESNLTRSVFLRHSDIGQPKAHAVVNRASELHPATQLRAIEGDIFLTLGLQQASEYDLIIAAVDNFEARLRINEIARIVKKPWLNTAIDQTQVVVESYPATDSEQAVCYECNLPTSVYERIAQRYSCAGLLQAAKIERKIPTTTMTASLVAALACQIGLKVVSAWVEPNQSMTDPRPNNNMAERVYLDLTSMAMSRSQLRSNEHCPACALHRPAKEIWAEFPQLQPADTIVELADAIISHAECRLCGYINGTIIGLRQKSVSDSQTLCPHCREQSISIDTIASGNWGEIVTPSFAGVRRQPQTAWLRYSASEEGSADNNTAIYIDLVSLQQISPSPKE